METNINVISQAEYVSNCIAKTPEYLRRNVSMYRAHAKEHGVRICNDGYPDARFKATFDDQFRPARMTISVAREKYVQMVRQMEYCQCACNYKAVTQEVALSNIEKIKKFFS